MTKYIAKRKQFKQNWIRPENFYICFCASFDLYSQKLILERPLRVFSRGFLGPLNGPKNSILNWVLKLNLLRKKKFFDCFKTCLSFCVFSRKKEIRLIFTGFDLYPCWVNSLSLFFYSQHLHQFKRRRQ